MAGLDWRQAAHSPSSACHNMPRAFLPTVLIVDDDPGFVSFVADWLESSGYAPLIASNSDDGSKLARAFRPDLILLDLAIPGRSGLDVLRELKVTPITCEIPVVVVSAYTRFMSSMDARLADGVLEKPVEAATLLEVVARVVSGRAS
jgi:DNA-binding response OmpR family regulator